MGSWSVSINGNDTAADLKQEYSAAFYKYDVEEAVKKIDEYVRENVCNESDEETWCDYYYSLVDFMWRKGILTDSVKEKAIEMIDSGFGLEVWADSGEKTLNARKKVLEAFRSKILSPQPSKKRIKPNVYTEKIFENGDIIAIQLQTAGKPYTQNNWRPISEEYFHSLDGKYVLMQLVECHASWSSRIVPEVKDYWAYFRLFDGIYDDMPSSIDPYILSDAKVFDSYVSPEFYCECSMFYFKKRKYSVICNCKEILQDYKGKGNNGIFFGINKPWYNADSLIISAMDLNTTCQSSAMSAEDMLSIVKGATQRGRYDTHFSSEENKARFEQEEKAIVEKICSVIAEGGKLYSIPFGKEIGIVTVREDHIDNLYIKMRFQRNGFGTELLRYAFDVAVKDAYIDVPLTNEVLLHICDKLNLIKVFENTEIVRMKKGGD